MATLPTLNSGAVAQYPLARQTRFSTQIVEFLDGSEQRFRDYPASLRRWTIRLDQLEAGELQALANFFDSVGPVARFAFTDPWDGTVHPSCVVEGGEFTAEWNAEWTGRTEITIREDRT